MFYNEAFSIAKYRQITKFKHDLNSLNTLKNTAKRY